MYLQNYDNVILHPNSSSDQQQNPINDYQHIKIKSFQQLPLQVQIDEQLIKKYEPQYILYSSSNTVIVQVFLNKQFYVGNFAKEQRKIVKICKQAKYENQLLQKIHKYKNCQKIIKVSQFYQNCLVFQKYYNNLQMYISQRIFVQDYVILKILQDCFQAISLISELDIIHFDIKPSNILIKKSTNQNIFVLSDFGISFYINQVQQTKLKMSNKKQQNVSWQYFPPQFIEENSLTCQKANIWGLGCVLFQVLTSQTLLPAQTKCNLTYHRYYSQFASPQKIQMRIKRYTSTTIWNRYKNLVLMMLSKCPKQRAGLKRVNQQLQKIKVCK